MRRFLVLGALIAAVQMVSMSAATGGPPGTFSYEENGRAVAHDNATASMQMGKDVAVQKVVLEPGFNGLWPPRPSDTLVVMNKGTLSAYTNCTEKKAWEAGHAYFQRAGQTLVKNEGKEPAELIAVFLNLSGDRPSGVVPGEGEGPAPCAAAGTFSATDVARAAPYSNAAIDVEAGKKIVVQSFKVEPGFNFFWHTHPGETLVLQMSGTITEYFNCDEKLVWEPGYVYHHTPGHHSHAKETAKNEGKETAVFTVVFFNVWDWHPSPLVPRDVQPPYTECPTRSLA